MRHMVRGVKGSSLIVLPWPKALTN